MKVLGLMIESFVFRVYGLCACMLSCMCPSAVPIVLDFFEFFRFLFIYWSRFCILPRKSMCVCVCVCVCMNIYIYI